MPQHLIIVTGCPGSGKSQFAARLIRHFASFELLSYDTLKEEYFDRFGFNSLEEREALNDRSLDTFYQLLSGAMEKGGDLVIEYPFCRKHAAELRRLIGTYGYQALTVLLTGDMKVLYQRGKTRNRDTARHPGHLVSVYHKGVPVREQDYIRPVSFPDFLADCRKKDYNIQIGPTVTVDMTAPDRLDYTTVFSEIQALL